MTSWINSCRTAACDALVWCCSNVGSWFLACIRKVQKTVNKSYCQSYISRCTKKCMNIFYVSASFVDVAKNRENVLCMLQSGSHNIHFETEKHISHCTHNRIYDA